MSHTNTELHSSAAQKSKNVFARHNSALGRPEQPEARLLTHPAAGAANAMTQSRRMEAPSTDQKEGSRENENMVFQLELDRASDDEG